MTREQLIKQALLKSLNVGEKRALGYTQLKLKARNYAISKKYDTSIIEEIEGLKKDQIELYMKALQVEKVDVFWYEGRAWLL